MPIQQTGLTLGSLQVAQATIAASVTTTATSSATATVLMTLGPFESFSGGYIIELNSPGVTKGTTSVTLELWVDGVFNQSIAATYLNAVAVTPFAWRGFVTLGGGVHTLTVRGFVDAGTGTLTAGTGATGAQPNAILTARVA